jgi:Na+/proline symporter
MESSSAWASPFRMLTSCSCPSSTCTNTHSFGMILTTFVLKRYNYELQTSEMFSTAGRTVKSGLVASAVVSSWTWAATLLQSSAVAYRYGVSGPFWYASGATVQIILFATIAIELKRRAPNAHTFLEVIRARYGAVTHIVFMVFGIFTNILVTSMLLTGGSAVVTSVRKYSYHNVERY